MNNPYLPLHQKYQFSPAPSANTPIFILSSIWRSGSTLLQRSICTDQDIVLWGEPYSYCNLITSLMYSTKPFLLEDWPPPNLSQSKTVFSQLDSFFIANLYPEMKHLYNGHRAMLDRLFQDSATEQGKSRFGAKFVRLSLDEAHYLQWLYPDAKFIVLIRNPWDCWKSYKGYNWIYRWPKAVIQTVDQFAKIWMKQTSELIQLQSPNAITLRYEDFLAEDFDWDAFRDFCELPKMTNAALSKQIKGTNYDPRSVTDEDCERIAKICNPIAKELGYLGLKQTLNLK